MSQQAEPPVPSTRPYLIRALYEWCSENGFSPYIAVHVDASVQVPMEFVRNGEIVLNVSMEATKDLHLGNEYISFKARFGGVSREILVPITHVIAIYARENGQGMAFPAPAPAQAPAAGDAPAPSSLRAVTPDDDASPPEPGGDGPGRPGGRPQLKRVK
ncbi:MAG: ClpXP protease specificity-enhancing factor [Hydrogenophaga sp.]|uniref:ClpXP protease specificity-enhancing factor n=1 Tax=Hydrogenophaga sp. TaxID=1904254 RepID=UPI0016B7888C|nr:ClpXP protease specificity-enhancing factor [Hydrogenophaga sp.]NIM42549.1 ClpXP protease specificity-enhancing factor [Hydrogenophaga sp.]NIN27700.1 ClpXP protease specificity-enhancing factor [Hydrogenophaga sp.]NIN32520.1 ClpXP protease specificity-enhancing factor [Hydrogenophaga sp.]NIN56971.1 ClpXP protease specificity-enhancing factor [Hydrogenophaga sp.]NIO53116.1 ClpXP protease specificity-enhancing factor [Hydrogenophaga sp.]